MSVFETHADVCRPITNTLSLPRFICDFISKDRQDRAYVYFKPCKLGFNGIISIYF